MWHGSHRCFNTRDDPMNLNMDSPVYTHRQSAPIIISNAAHESASRGDIGVTSFLCRALTQHVRYQVQCSWEPRYRSAFFQPQKIWYKEDSLACFINLLFSYQLIIPVIMDGRSLIPIYLLLCTTNALPNLVRRDIPGIYFAQGDSYGSDIAAGTYLNDQPGSADWKCSRFTGAYGFQLNTLLGGDIPNDPAFQFTLQACSGALAEDVQKTQHIGNEADLATLTVGGNNANFGPIVDSCVYGLTYTSLNEDNCNQALSATKENIANNVLNPVWNTVWNILNDAKSSTFQLDITNYTKFWNAQSTQCDSISFSYWGGTNAAYTMTQARRQAMNDLTDELNAQLASVVQNFNNHNPPEPRVHFVDIDS